MKAVHFPQEVGVAGADQGYVPLPYLYDVEQYKDRRLGKVVQPAFTFMFKPSPEELEQLVAGRSIAVTIHSNVIPPIRVYLGDTQETEPNCITSIEGREGHQEYLDRKNDWRPQVFLDGVQQKHCIYANKEAGLIRRMKTDETGKLLRQGEYFVEEDASGVVEIKWERNI